MNTPGNLGLIIGCLMAVSAGTAGAYGNHEMLSTRVVGQTVQPQSTGIDIRLQVQNSGDDDIKVMGLIIEGAAVSGFESPVPIKARSSEIVRARVTFPGVPPENFAVVLDLGPHGTGPVYVLPSMPANTGAN